MTKTRAFSCAALALAAAAFIGSAPALAGPRHPCDHRIDFASPAPLLVRPVVAQQVVAQPVIVQPVVVQSVAPTTIVTVPAASDAAIRQGWSPTDTVRISTPVAVAPAIAPGYRAAWADAGDTIVVAPAPVVTSPSIIVVPDNAVVQRNSIVEPLGAHDRLVVLNEFTRPGYDGRSLLYRDSTGLVYERTLYGGSGIFYDHLGRRCRYDRASSMIVILDDRVVRDYNHNGVRDDDRYVDTHRRAEPQFRRDSTYHPAGSPSDWRDRYRSDSFRRNDSHSSSGRAPSLRDDRPSDSRRVTSDRSANRAVNGRLRDDSRHTGNEPKSTRSAARPKR